MNIKKNNINKKYKEVKNKMKKTLTKEVERESKPSKFKRGLIVGLGLTALTAATLTLNSYNAPSRVDEPIQELDERSICGGAGAISNAVLSILDDYGFRSDPNYNPKKHFKYSKDTSD